MIGRLRLLFLAAILPAAILSGCGLFGGGDKEDKGKASQEQAMSGDAAASGGVSGSGATAGNRSDAGGGGTSGGILLPAASLGLSAITLVTLIVHINRHRD